MNNIVVQKAVKLLVNAGYVDACLYKDMPKIQTIDSLDISYIIPVYNSAQYLRKCLESVINQDTRYSYEVICVNDGSSDESLSIIKEYSARYHIVKYINQKNQGISIARNVGIVLAQGKYIGFIDSDDYVDRRYTEKMLNAANNFNADVVQVGYQRTRHRGNALYNYSNGNFCIYKEEYELYYEKIRGTVWGACFRRTIFENARFPEKCVYEDMVNKALFLRLTRKTVGISLGRKVD